MAKHVHSTDPRKPVIVAALKKMSGGTKVTMLEETQPGVFAGDCLRPIQHKSKAGGMPTVFEGLGRFIVTAAECGLGDPDDAAPAAEDSLPEPATAPRYVVEHQPGKPKPYAVVDTFGSKHRVVSRCGDVTNAQFAADAANGRAERQAEEARDWATTLGAQCPTGDEPTPEADDFTIDPVTSAHLHAIDAFCKGPLFTEATAARIWAETDAYGEPGLIPEQGWDWSGIRDSSPEAVARMAAIVAEIEGAASATFTVYPERAAKALDEAGLTDLAADMRALTPTPEAPVYPVDQNGPTWFVVAVDGTGARLHATGRVGRQGAIDEALGLCQDVARGEADPTIAAVLVYPAVGGPDGANVPDYSAEPVIRCDVPTLEPTPEPEATPPASEEPPTVPTATSRPRVIQGAERNLPVGTRLWGRYKGELHTLEVVATADGIRYRLDGTTDYRTPSGAGQAAQGGKKVNGWKMWTVGEPGERAAAPTYTAGDLTLYIPAGTVLERLYSVQDGRQRTARQTSTCLVNAAVSGAVEAASGACYLFRLPTAGTEYIYRVEASAVQAESPVQEVEEAPVTV